MTTHSTGTSCSTIADGFNGLVADLANHDVTLSAVSREPLAILQAYKRHRGWTFPWASSLGSDFNLDPEPVAQFAAMCGTDAPRYSRDRPGISAFVLEDGVVYHTYGLWGIYQWLDCAPKRRNETGVWWCRHDECD
jgi:predicted dithiol-disulfide oxidoreductase (DUF899 family)